MAHKFEPGHVERLLSGQRHKDIAPEMVLREAGLKSGGSFADIGCGPGFFTLPAAHIVGEKGVVYAIDTEEKMLDRLRERMPPSNVMLIKSTESSFSVKGSAVDMAFLGYMLHEAEDRPRFLKEVKRIVKDEGSVVIIDWKKIREEKGPPLEERLTEDEVVCLLKAAGFEEVKAVSFNESHYKISAVKRG